AKMAGWSDSKVSRLNIQDMAVTFVLLEKVWETSLIREVARQAVEAVMPRNKKRPAATERSDQIQMDF
ncbi:CII family transcriptional regulator, partial [Salmonella enterica subsp. enterica serovar Braenderup]